MKLPRLHQHITCECARISEIVGGIGGKPVYFIRFNPDKFKDSQGVYVDLPLNKELNNIPETFCVRLIQLYYNQIDNDSHISEEDITDKVVI